MTLQAPPQQSEGDPHTSPTCPQNDDGAHTPFEQSFEQHCELCVHALPVVAQLVFRGVHVPPEPQTPPQHCRLVVHARLSDVQLGKAQTLLMQLLLQQSDVCAHAPPSLRQLPPASGRNAPPSGIALAPSGEALPPSDAAPPSVPLPPSSPSAPSGLPESSPTPAPVSPPELTPPSLPDADPSREIDPWPSIVPSSKPPSSPPIANELLLPHPTIPRLATRNAMRPKVRK
jgi:hypothetical protein